MASWQAPEGHVHVTWPYRNCVEKEIIPGRTPEDIEQKISSKKIGQNDMFEVGLFNFDVVWPEEKLEIEKDGNENSVAGILRVKNTDWSMFLSGDMEIEAEQKLVWRQILKTPVTVLKVSHHGSKTATGQDLLDILKPKMAVISVGGNNRFGHPTKEVLERLENVGAEIKRTDIDGETILYPY